MDTDKQLVTYEAREGRAYITLNRPEKYNALTFEMIDTLVEYVVRAEDDDDVRVIVFRAEGKNFCAGHDLSAMGDGDELSDKWKDDPIWLEPEQVAACMLEDSQIFISLFRMNKPTIAAMRGPAAGSGLALATACDLRIVSETAFFKTSYASAGRCGEPALRACCRA